jgi:hypothetical protein
MSLEDLKPGTFDSRDLVSEILRLLPEVLNPEADKEAGRLKLAQSKEWMIEAVAEYIRLTTNSRPDWRTPDDSVRESER